MTIPKYTKACGAEIRSVFLSRTKIIEATMDAFVGLKERNERIYVHCSLENHDFHTSARSRGGGKSLYL